MIYFGSRRVFCSLFGVSQGFCQLIWGLAGYQLIFDLAMFFSAYSGSRRVLFSLFLISQGFVQRILDLVKLFSLFGISKVFLQLIFGLAFVLAAYFG